jgi:hypothetical protein
MTATVNQHCPKMLVCYSMSHELWLS